MSIWGTIPSTGDTLVFPVQAFYAVNLNALQSQVRMPTARMARTAVPEEPVNRCMCVADADGNYMEFVMVTITHDELGILYTVHYYEFKDGERLLDTAPPTMRLHAGAEGLISPKWCEDTATWEEAATAAKIAAWEMEHPAPEPLAPSADNLADRVATLEADKADKAEVQAVWDSMAAAYSEGVQEA